MNTLFKLAASVFILVSAASAGVTVTSPVNGATVGTPVHVVANATSSYPIVAMKVYVDNNIVFSASANSIDTTISMASGSRYIVVQAWDSTGAVQKSALTVNVAYTTTTQTSTSTGVNVSSPADGATVGSPVHFVASTVAGNPIVATKIYVDNNIAYSATTASIDTYVAMAGGTRYVTVQSWDNAGGVYKKSLKLNVSGTTTTTTTTTGGKLITDIDQMTGWESCDSCAGIDGVGPKIPYSQTQGRVDPSLDGKSSEFWIGGTTPYSNALWWKQLGGNSSATNFVYDLHYYIKNPNASQALEFDVNQSVNNKKYIFGTECNLKEFKTWRIWDTANVKWVNTGVPCAVPAAYKWHHLVWEFKREGDYTTYIAVTVNGVKTYINRQFLSRPVTNAYEINVAFQMDGNSTQEDHSVWLDKVILNYW